MCGGGGDGCWLMGGVSDQDSMQISLGMSGLTCTKLSTTIIGWWCSILVNEYRISKTAIEQPIDLFSEVQELYDSVGVLYINSRSARFAFQHLCFHYSLNLWDNFQLSLWQQWNFIIWIFTSTLFNLPIDHLH